MASAPGTLIETLRTVVLLIAACFLVGGAAALEPRLKTYLGDRIAGLVSDPNTRMVGLQRTWRYAYWAMGWQLPGTPDLKNLDGRLEAAGLELGAPVFIRIFKREFLLEVWLQKNGRFERFASYPICRFSGRLGPKLKQGDRQAPEGIYTVSKGQLNPASRWHRSFNLGFPNRYDRNHSRTGSFLMVHGGCSSIGCYAMTNDVVDEIWRIITASLNAGQKRFQVQVFPFHMTSDNLADAKEDKWKDFWTQLKTAHDLFEETKTPPRVDVCGKRYIASAGTPGNNGSRRLNQSCKNLNAMVAN
ncbi:MAG: murein L,D-transpeptidase family protein [Filomicrobium sp.]